MRSMGNQKMLWYVALSLLFCLARALLMVSLKQLFRFNAAVSVKITLPIHAINVAEHHCLDMPLVNELNSQVFVLCMQKLTIVPNKKVLGKEFRKDQKVLSESLEVRKYILIHSLQPTLL